MTSTTSSTISSYSVSVTATDSDGTTTSTVSFTWNVWNKITVASPLPSGQLYYGVPVSLQVSATDSAAGSTLSYSASGLPAGLSINSSTGLISGTPSTLSGGTSSKIGISSRFHPCETATALNSCFDSASVM